MQQIRGLRLRESKTSLTLVLLNPDMSCLCKQCRSRSVGFLRSQLIWICTVCHYVNLYKNLDHFKAVPLLQFFFVRLWFHMSRMFYHYLFIISPSFLCFGKAVLCACCISWVYCNSPMAAIAHVFANTQVRLKFRPVSTEQTIFHFN